MADAMDTLKNLLGDDAEDKIKNVMSSFSGGDGDSGDSAELMQIRDMINNFGKSSNDPRSNLLMSLKPYMRETRRHSIDSAVRLLNLTKLSKLIKL